MASLMNCTKYLMNKNNANSPQFLSHNRRITNISQNQMKICQGKKSIGQYPSQI